MRSIGDGRVERKGRPASDLEVRHLRVLVALVESGSVTAAARALGLAQSTVSESLASLERTLGTAVIERQRGSRTAALTTAGQTLLPHAHEVLASLEQAQLAVAGVSTRVPGSVEILANESVSTYLLPRVLAQLRSRWTKTRFPVSVATCPGVRQGVKDGTFDVGLYLESLASGSSLRFAERRVVAPRIPLVVFTTPTHPTVRGSLHEPVPKHALGAFPLLLSDAAGDFHGLVENYFHDGGLQRARLQATGSVEGVKRGVLAEPRALGVLPAYALAEELKARRVVRLDVRPPPPRMHLVALLSRSRSRHPSTEDLLDSIRHGFGPDDSG